MKTDPGAAEAERGAALVDPHRRGIVVVDHQVDLGDQRATDELVAGLRAALADPTHVRVHLNLGLLLQQGKEADRQQHMSAFPINSSLPRNKSLLPTRNSKAIKH